MKQFITAILIMALGIAMPSAVFANVLNKDGSVDSTQSHVKSTDWNTGLGRHDAVIRWAAGENYWLKTVGMFDRGASNTLAGWSEFFIQPVNWSKNSPVVVGQINGLVMGLTMGTLRTASGILDLATCWIPFWRGIPMGKPALGLKNVHTYETIEDAEAYDQSTKEYFFKDETFI